MSFLKERNSVLIGSNQIPWGRSLQEALVREPVCTVIVTQIQFRGGAFVYVTLPRMPFYPRCKEIARIVLEQKF